ncbi:MAG TPA: sigma-70 family RNA polymerase sigma factor [Candidatus Limnocylindrales bacterium]|nr:sigma-70 family RNA polymerase sigma factor [Candidatus Limnocylindrales bacterium]
MRLPATSELAASELATSELENHIRTDAAILDQDFEALVRLYRPRVFRFALASLRDVDAAETVTQDCFLRAYQARRRFRQDCGVHTWLMQIAVNLIRDVIRNRRFQFWRRASRTAKPVDAAGHALADRARSPEAQALIQERVAAVWSAAERLPQKQRAVFLLRFVEDMDLLEIAFATGMKEGTVKTHLFRALRAVREHMGDTA